MATTDLWIRGIHYTPGTRFQVAETCEAHSIYNEWTFLFYAQAGHWCTFNARNDDVTTWKYACSYDGQGNCLLPIEAFPYATYAVTYNANGGSGAPDTQYKVWGRPLTLSTAVPTKVGYRFLGWATSASGTASYQPGDTYGTDAPLNLYATWTPETSVMSDVSGTIGSSISLSWTRYDATYTHKLTYRFGDVTGTIGTGLGTSKTWTPPMGLCNQLPNSVSGTGSITLETFNGDVSLGSNTYVLTLAVPSSVVPTVSASTAEGTASGFGVYATNLSTLKVTLSTAGAYGSTVQTASLTYDGIQYDATVSNNAAVITTNTLLNDGSRSYSVTVTDSRGRTKTVTGTITVYEWSDAVAQAIDIDVYGTQVTIDVPYRISAVNNLNSKKVTLSRTRVSDGTTTVVVNKATLSTYTGTWHIVETVSDVDTESYEYTVTIEDTKGSSSLKMNTGIPVLSFYAGGKGATFFGEATGPGIHAKVDGADIDYTITSEDWETLEEWYEDN